MDINVKLFLVNIFTGFLPESLSSSRLLIFKALLLAFIAGFIFSYLFNYLLGKLWHGFKCWLKEKKRDSRILSKKIPNTELVGEVTHYFDNLSVAVVKVKKNKLCTGDKLLMRGKFTNFKFQVTSLQINKKPVEAVHAGQEAGLMVPDVVKSGDLVYKLRT